MAKSGLINPWSLSTTVRSPERLLGFLAAIEEMDALDIAMLESEEPIAFAAAQRIFSRKQYTDPPMRGRTSYKPLAVFQ